ncbi:hypothetical protein ATANTOWER_028304 [Ataeniobius toweri]|uniref:Uncharacterized protein n=1 Tax=Ataeniobius toweri TaxID=208326 RepID=A0ABU7CBP0_9TELE|nr:hypothetical protein [Ataeniobius toweri]
MYLPSYNKEYLVYTSIIRSLISKTPHLLSRTILHLQLELHRYTCRGPPHHGDREMPGSPEQCRATAEELAEVTSLDNMSNSEHEDTRTNEKKPVSRGNSRS